MPGSAPEPAPPLPASLPLRPAPCTQLPASTAWESGRRGGGMQGSVKPSRQHSWESAAPGWCRQHRLHAACTPQPSSPQLLQRGQRAAQRRQAGAPARLDVERVQGGAGAQEAAGGLWHAECIHAMVAVLEPPLGGHAAEWSRHERSTAFGAPRAPVLQGHPPPRRSAAQRSAPTTATDWQPSVTSLNRPVRSDQAECQMQLASRGQQHVKG